MNYAQILKSFADDIEKLKADFPQLADFSVAKCFNEASLRIDFSFHTHRATHRGGWTSGVPNPDDDGIWFHLDLYDPDSMSQIHTQPVFRKIRIGEKLVCFLILEGAKTKPVAGHISALIAAYQPK